MASTSLFSEVLDPVIPALSASGGLQVQRERGNADHVITHPRMTRTQLVAWLFEGRANSPPNRQRPDPVEGLESDPQKRFLFRRPPQRSVGEGELDSLRAVVSGERNTEDSRRKADSVSAGMQRRKRRGLHIGGPDKYGYRTQRDQYGTPYRDQPLAIIPAEARVVERIITGIANGVSQKQVARDLNDAGIPTKRGGKWSQSLISHIVSDPFYAGYVPVDGELVEGKHEAIVDMEPLGRAQCMSARRRKQGDGQGGRPPNRPALFTNGHLRWGECGSAMGIRNKSRDHDGTVYTYVKYLCTGRERDVRSCSMKPIDADAVEQQMLHQLNKS
jgi:hypothetical protein